MVSALGSGPRGPRFESGRPDYIEFTVEMKNLGDFLRNLFQFKTFELDFGINHLTLRAKKDSAVKENFRFGIV